MGQRDRAFQDKLDQHMEEMRRLHDGTLRAADRVEGGAERAEKAVEKLETWVLSVQKRVNRLEHWRTAIATGGLVFSYLLKDKAMTVLGLKASQ